MYTAALLLIFAVFVVWALATITQSQAPGACSGVAAMPVLPVNVARPMNDASTLDVQDVHQASNAVSEQYAGLSDGAVNLGVGIRDGTPITNLDAGVSPQDNLCPPEQEPPCPNNLQWQNTLPGCGSFHIPARVGLPRSYITDSRVWQGDLNPLIQERAALLAKEWDPYEHIKARQAWMQFLSTNFSARSDRHMRPISSLEQAGQPLNMYGSASNPGVPGWCALNEVDPTA